MNTRNKNRQTLKTCWIPIHFILTSNILVYGYYLAILSVIKTQDTDRVLLWAFDEPQGEYWPLLKDKIELHIIDRPDIAALPDKQSLRYCTDVSNLIEWQILYKYGGMCLDLDTFCVKDALYHLMNSDKELVLPDESLPNDPGYPFYNASIVMSKPASKLMKQVLEKSEVIAKKPDLQRGEISITLNNTVRSCRDRIDVVKYGILGGGGSDRVVDRLIDTQNELPSEVEIVHAFANDSPFFNKLSEQFVKDSDILFARLVRNTLDQNEWNPGLSKQESSTPIQRNVDLPVFSGLQPKLWKDILSNIPEIATEVPDDFPVFTGVVRQKKRFHLLGLPHVPTDKGDSLACAFSQKVIKMGKMLKSLGHTVFFYGVEGSDVECDEFIQVSTKKVIKETYGDYDMKKVPYKHNIGDLAYKTFNKNTIPEIKKRMQVDDFLLIPFSPQAYIPILEAFNTSYINMPDKLYLVVEMGIGYNNPICRFKVFESSSHMHYNWGLQKQGNGKWYDVVIPNYFDPDDFCYQDKKSDYFVFLGRVIVRKGIREAIAIINAIGAKLIIAGQNGGEGINLDHPGVEYIGFVGVEERKKLLANARALFLPTQYVEPFGGVIIEAAFSGTPVITSDWGAFQELVIHNKTGYRCRTLSQFVRAAQNIGRIKPADCYRYAMANFTLDRVKWMYDEYFDMLLDVKRGTGGWMQLHPERNELDWLQKYFPGDSYEQPA